MNKPFSQYAKIYNCTVAQAIADRDYPMSRNEYIEEFKHETGKLPTESEIHEMRPDSKHVAHEERRLQDWEDFDMGRR